jgi:hypothetical protein
LFFDPAFQGRADFVQGGHLTAQGLAALHSHMPYADSSHLEHDRRLKKIDDLFTAGLLASYVRWKLTHCSEAEKDVQPPALGSPSPIHQ